VLSLANLTKNTIARSVRAAKMCQECALFTDSPSKANLKFLKVKMIWRMREAIMAIFKTRMMKEQGELYC
jgi:hypothetical protein